MASDALERIRSLPFVQADKDGLRIHDAVREAASLTFRSENPQLYRQHRRAAYHHFMSELRAAAAPEYWSCTANLLYVLENSVVREAFFPSGAQPFVIEPARPQDESRILDIVDRHEDSSLRDPLVRWWHQTPESFFVARDSKGAAVGFYCVFDARQFPARMHRDDPVTRGWLDHLARHPIPQHQCALFLRRWLAVDTGEAPSAIQAACWLDLKRKYLELRPRLRRVYLTVQEIAPYAAVAQRLGFQILEGTRHDDYSSAMLDFGTSSVDGWLARLVAAELGVEQDGLLDYNARELVSNGKRVGLSRLEFGVMEYLNRHPGEAVSRIALLENVWQQSFDGGSNVVDVVVRGLRKKPGGQGRDSRERSRRWISFESDVASPAPGIRSIRSTQITAHCELAIGILHKRPALQVTIKLDATKSGYALLKIAELGGVQAQRAVDWRVVYPVPRFSARMAMA